MIKTVHCCDGAEFESEVNELIKDGWSILSAATCAAINSADYDFCPSFTAIMSKDEPVELIDLF